ncbi:MAG TPA: MEDS domain-containing protein [Streptosporangiaceae bacterium]|nr:MEDS domain-containing protein [Streptosporangiaceae bacterium]
MKVEVVPSAARLSGHVCWLVDDPAGYLAAAAGMLRGDSSHPRRQSMVFGPRGSTLARLAETTAVTAADPAQAFPGGVLDPPAVAAMIRDHAQQARHMGHDGLLLVADMDWLLPLRATPAQVTAHELRTDRLAAELDITIVCAYRRSSFSPAHIDSALAVHPSQRGDGQAPQFRLTAAGASGWRLSGEVDICTSDTFQAAISTVASLGDCTIDVTGLRFIDVAGLRALARAASSAPGGISLNGSSPVLRRLWQLTGLADGPSALRLDAASPDAPHAGVS